MHALASIACSRSSIAPTLPGCAVGVSLDGDTVGQPRLRDGGPGARRSAAARFHLRTRLRHQAIHRRRRARCSPQQGKLSLDDPVRKYIPELPDYGAPLTIRHLLNHTSGLRDWGSVEAIAGWPRTTRAYTHAHVLDILSRQRSLNYPPGAEYSYTNSGYNLAAILVGRVSGKPLAEFTREAIFTPLGMTSTSWRDDFRRIVKGRAIAYSQNGGTVRQLMPFEDVHGNGGLLTTVGDLLRWNQKFTIAAPAGPGQADRWPHHRLRRRPDGAALQGARRNQPQRHHRGLQRVAGPLSRRRVSRWPCCAIRARPTERSSDTRWPISSWATPPRP